MTRTRRIGSGLSRHGDAGEPVALTRQREEHDREAVEPSRRRVAE
jgi:hypothetical protein